MFSRLKKIINLLKIYRMDFQNDIKYSAYLRGKHQDKETLLAFLAVEAHTIEKGLTMPEKRFNFGHTKIKNIIEELLYCSDHFDSEGDRFEDIVGIIKEYSRWHRDNNVEISDPEIAQMLQIIEQRFNSTPPVSQIYNETKAHYFSKSESSFKDFAFSRHSCRNLSGKVNDEDLHSALELAIKTVPSTCNRQSVRVHVLESKTVLSIQKGNRGFGHLADKYLLITSTLTHWPSLGQRNAPYVDGGIFLMNLLYALHFYKIAGVTLNMYLGEQGTKRMHKDLSIPENETPIALIAIGTPPENFDLARSTRRSFDAIVTYHE